MEDLGKTIRKLRKARKLSLKEVADQIGCSPSYISQVETAKIDPSASRLKEIAQALGTTIVQLFSEQTSEKEIVRKEDRQRASIPASKMIFEILVNQSPDKKMDARIATIDPGGGSNGLYSHHGEEFGYVLEGTAELIIDEKVFNLNEGDAFYFSSENMHSFKNIGDDTLKILWINHPPSY